MGAVSFQLMTGKRKNASLSANVWRQLSALLQLEAVVFIFPHISHSPLQDVCGEKPYINQTQVTQHLYFNPFAQFYSCRLTRNLGSLKTLVFNIISPMFTHHSFLTFFFLQSSIFTLLNILFSLESVHLFKDDPPFPFTCSLTLNFTPTLIFQMCVFLAYVCVKLCTCFNQFYKM